MGVLDGLKFPDDIKKLNIDQLKALADEIRGQILDTAEKNGGHLASNLGIVETTIALYYAFDFPKDKIVFDVGHQCYAHKILSGRKEEFSSIRTDGGVSGFPDRSESEYDSFGTGHAGTSVAAGLGFCAARDKSAEDYYVVTVVGDGALSNGLNLEAITASSSKPKKFIIVLNDNGMSISKNRNGFYRYISKRTARRGYVRGKRGLRKIFGNSFITTALAGFRNFIKRIIIRNDYFENHGFKYVGLIDGNNVKELISVLSDVKYTANEWAIFLHVKTTKGKGFEKAETRADVYHGVGKHLQSSTGGFATALGKSVNALIEKDENIVAITAAMKDGTGLKAVEEKHPKNFYDVGIAEEFAVTFAAGMAAGGLKPIVAVYSTFMQRAYDQILHDVCLQNLPVIFCLDRAGLVGRDGKTHQGTFDLSYLTHIPNISVFAPTNAGELDETLKYALTLNAPVAIRYPKDAGEERPIKPFTDGLWEKITDGEKVTILAVGPNMLNIAKKVAENTDGVSVISARTVKPLCEETLEKIKDTLIITLEENSVIGGFGSLIGDYYRRKNYAVRLKTFGVKDEFIKHGSIDGQLKENGLTVENIDKFIETQF